MIIKCIAKEPKQDKYNGFWYLPNKEYEVEEVRGKELIETKFFKEVKKAKKED